MKAQRLFRGPILWIILAVLGIALLIDYINGANGFQQKPTSEVVALINSDTPLKEVVLVEGEQTIRVEQKDAAAPKIQAKWIGDQCQAIISRLIQRVASGTASARHGRDSRRLTLKEGIKRPASRGDDRSYRYFRKVRRSGLNYPFFHHVVRSLLKSLAENRARIFR